MPEQGFFLALFDKCIWFRWAKITLKDKIKSPIILIYTMYPVYRYSTNFSAKKTQVLTNEHCTNIAIPKPWVVIYLRSKFTTIGDWSKDISIRFSTANKAFAMLKPVLRSTGLNIHTKIRILNSNILSFFLYGSEY